MNDKDSNSTGAELINESPEETMIAPTSDTATKDPVNDEAAQLASLDAEPDSATGAPLPVDQPGPTSAPAPIAVPAAKKAAAHVSKRRRVLFGITSLVVVAAAVVVWLVLSPHQAADEVAIQSSASDTKPQSKLGVAVTVADGSVTYQKSGDGPWRAVDTDTELQEGDQVQTDDASRAVLTLDDGSAIRLDANTVVRLESLAANDVKLHQVTGTVYSRVVASSRTYSVLVDDATYTALGTAFITLKTADENGVQVYQSSVSTAGQTVGEGKQYYTASADANAQGKVTDINIDALTEDTFIAWNLTEDEKDSKFKDTLGVLPTIKQRSDEKKAEELKAKDAADRAVKEKAEKDRKAAETYKKKEQDKPTAKITRGTMSLSLSGETFYWSYTGKAVHGYKLVWSKTNAVPHFTTDNSIYFSGISQLSGALPGVEKTGHGTFHIRVCAYTAGTEAEPCVDYSPVISFTRS